MRPIFLVALILTILFSGGYLYYHSEPVCRIPFTYQLGEIDERFDISPSAAVKALEAAEAVWEDAIGEELFVYDRRADFKVNFLFDDRQALADAEENFRERLSLDQSQNETINQQYDRLLSEYQKLQADYDSRLAAHQRQLARYNQEVSDYNQQGGAPESEFERLNQTRTDLETESVAINEMVEDLNALANELNQLGQAGNQLVQTYNQNVSIYNDRFGETREFTQGEYVSDEINIFKFSDKEELVLVLAHELGHALALEHVEDKSAVMHFFMGDQPNQLVLSGDDKLEFDRVCGEGASLATKLSRLLPL